MSLCYSPRAGIFTVILTLYRAVTSTDKRKCCLYFHFLMFRREILENIDNSLWNAQGAGGLLRTQVGCSDAERT